MRNVFKDFYILATRGYCVNIDGGKVFLMRLISDLIFFPDGERGLNPRLPIMKNEIECIKY